MFKFCTLTIFLFTLIMPQHSKAEVDLSRVQVITSFYEPYSYRADGEAQGIAVNQARKIFAELDFYPTIKVYPWARAYTHALNEPNTIIFSMARTPEREEKFHWIGEIVDFEVYLFRDQDREDINLDQLSDAAGYKVGALIKDVKGQYLEKNNIPIIDINDEEVGIKMVLNRRLDLLPTDLYSMKHRLKKNNLPEDRLVPAFHLSDISRPLYIALSKDTSDEIVEAFKAAYKRAFP